MQAATVVLDHDDMRRTLVRIAHEIVEKNPDGAVALVGIHRRGAVLAKRLQALTSELLEPNVRLGDVDISFYRDDFGRTGLKPEVKRTELPFEVEELVDRRADAAPRVEDIVDENDRRTFDLEGQLGAFHLGLEARAAEVVAVE